MSKSLFGSVPNSFLNPKSVSGLIYLSSSFLILALNFCGSLVILVEGEKKAFLTFHFKEVCGGRKLNNFLPPQNSPMSHFCLLL
ncbi:MAG: hypothetical protein AAF806_16970 [Bacteroidota bacterium]